VAMEGGVGDEVQDGPDEGESTPGPHGDGPY
jgi:hypothetical protein